MSLSSLSAIFSDFFVSDAFAQAGAASSPPSSGLMNLMPFLLILIVFYFLLIKPQQKKAKQQKEMVNNLKIGNRVCTNSGIFGIIKEVNIADGTVDLEIAKNVIIKVLKFSVNELIVKTD